MTREVAIKAIQDFIGWFKEDSLIRKALDMAIQALSQEPNRDMKEIAEIMKSDADAETKCKMISNILTAKPHYFELSQEPCDDAISRDAVMNEVKCWIGSGEYRYTNATDYLSKRIRELPPVTQKSETVTEFADRCRECGARYGKYRKEAKRWKNKWLKSQKSGNWIENAKTYYEELNKRGLGVDEYTPYFTDDIACSECLAKYNIFDNETQFFKFCPNCGAKMLEPQESEDK